MKKFRFDLADTGRGKPVLMLPGSYATPAAWRGIQEALKGDYRILSTSLPGYGSTPEVRPENDPNICHLIEFVGQVVETVDEPLHLVGHSWGAQLALAAVLAGRISPLSLICFEANPIFARRIDGVFGWRSKIESMVKSFEAALVAGDRNAAAIIIDFYSRPGFFQKMPDQVRAFCEATAATNLRDWHSAATFTPSFEEFAAFDIPVTLVRGSDTPEPIVDVTRELASNIPIAEEEVVEGADHFLISTHPVTCAEILQAHLEASTS